MPYTDPEKNRTAKKESARRKRGYKRGSRLQEFLQEFTNLESLLSELDASERLAIELYFGLQDGIPHSLQEIGDRLNCTKQNAQLIKEKALQEMRKKLLESS